jgi:glycine oxidase
VAYFAAKAGLKVTVIEARKIGGQGSRVAAGLMAPGSQITGDTPFARIALASVAKLSSLRDELLNDTNIDIELDLCGTLKIAWNAEQSHELQRHLPIQRQLGLDVRWLSREDALSIAPALATSICGAVYNSTEGQITTARFLAAYRSGAEHFHARFVHGTAQEMITDDTRVLGIHTIHVPVFGSHVVIATGAWVTQAATWLRIAAPVTPQRGQIVSDYASALNLTHIVFSDHTYVTPKKAGQVIVGGAANDYLGLVQRTTLEGVERLLQNGMQLVPHLASTSLGVVRAGQRPRTPDKLPIIGPILGWSGVSMAVGHTSNGLLLGAVSAQSIVAQLTNADDLIDAKHFRIDRLLSANHKIQL